MQILFSPVFTNAILIAGGSVGLFLVAGFVKKLFTVQALPKDPRAETIQSSNGLKKDTVVIFRDGRQQINGCNLAGQSSRNDVKVCDEGYLMMSQLG